jgi:hypothetical protein
MTTKPSQQKILKGILQTEEEDKHNHHNMGKNYPHRRVDKQMELGNNLTLQKYHNDNLVYNFQ